MRRACLGLLVALAFASVSGRALAQSVPECNASNDKSLAQQKQGQLMQAQKELATCAADACPDEVKTACRKRSEEISAALPSIAIEVTDATGKPLKNVDITVDGRPLDPDDTSVTVNPGAHKFVFTLAGKAPLERTIFVAQGEKMHHERITFAADSPSAPIPPTRPLPPPVVTPPVEVTPPPRIVPTPNTPPVLVESKHGSLYVQASLGGLNYSFYPLVPDLGYSYAWAGYRPDIEVGFHLSGRGDGLSFGIRQGLILSAFGGSQLPPRAGGMTQLRVGFDIIVPLAHRELDFVPYFTAGLVYTFDSIIGPLVDAPSAGIVIGTGVDVKLFVTGGFYAFARPVEAAFLCFTENGLCAVDFDFALGVGFAFGGVTRERR